MTWRTSFLLTLCCFIIIKMTGQASIHALNIKLDDIISEGIDSMAFPGAQILIRHQDKVVYHRVWGHHTYDQKQEVKFDDIYDMASVTKVSTGLAVLMKLHGEQKFDLDAPLGQYVKAIKRGNKKNLTFRQVLSHQARLEPYIVFWQSTLKGNGKYKCKTFKDKYSKNYPIQITDKLYLHKNYKRKMQKAIRKSKLRNEEVYLYSGLIFLLLPDVISEITGRPFSDYLYDNIYTPIGALSLTYNPLEKYNKEHIVPTEFDTMWRHQLVHGTVHDEAAAMLGGISCNAGLFGNAEDLSKLFQLYVNNGSWEDKRIMDPQSVNLFTQYQYVGNRRGLGFDKPLRVFNKDQTYIAQDASTMSFGHSGFTGTFVWADPKYDLVVVFMSNRVYPDRSHRKLYSMSIRPRFHQAIYDYIMAL